MSRDLAKTLHLCKRMMLRDLQFGVPGSVEKEKKLVVVAFCEQVIREQHHQSHVARHLLWTVLKQLHTVVNKALVNFLYHK